MPKICFDENRKFGWAELITQEVLGPFASKLAAIVNYNNQKTVDMKKSQEINGQMNVFKQSIRGHRSTLLNVLSKKQRQIERTADLNQLSRSNIMAPENLSKIEADKIRIMKGTMYKNTKTVQVFQFAYCIESRKKAIRDPIHIDSHREF